jgi:hypothetical protein
VGGRGQHDHDFQSVLSLRAPERSHHGARDEFHSDENFNETFQNHPKERKLTGLIIQYTLMGKKRINPKIRLNI